MTLRLPIHWLLNYKVADLIFSVDFVIPWQKVLNTILCFFLVVYKG
ncbi:hypothetical protein SAMN05421754_101128 [Nitrosomonas sp. Nm58]|nr:hypothetical protein SAMN05421754_101128 [Nitrosomonas sp. Nm58]